jgi:hypothetical protein
MLIITSHTIALYPFYPITAHGDNPIRLVQSVILTSGLTLALFGVLLLAYRLGRHHRTRLFRVLAGGALFCLFAATLGAVGNIVQFGAAHLFGLTIGGVVVAGATAGVMVGAMGLLSPFVVKLSPHRLTILSVILMIVGSLLALIQMAVMLIIVS